MSQNLVNIGYAEVSDAWNSWIISRNLENNIYLVVSPTLPHKNCLTSWYSFTLSFIGMKKNLKTFKYNVKIHLQNFFYWTLKAFYKVNFMVINMIQKLHILKKKKSFCIFNNWITSYSKEPYRLKRRMVLWNIKISQY